MRRAFLFALLWPSVVLAHDTLPLTRGLFVPIGVGCDDPGNKDYVDYEGASYGAYELGCDILDVVKVGNIYRITQHCSFAGDDYGEEVESWKIINSKTFEQNGFTYRYCVKKTY